MSSTLSPRNEEARRPAARVSEKSARDDAAPDEKINFIWGAGIECSFIPHLKVDQFEWTGHDRAWREDLRRAARSPA